MIGIVTGKASRLLVIDCDTMEGYQAIQELIPESIETPTAKTPRGGRHIYFEYHDEGNLTVGTDIMSGVDFRGEGGYIIAPPSENGSGGSYTWLDGLSIHDLPPARLPQDLYNKIYINTYRQCKESVRSAPDDCEMFVQGRRDDDLFHVAYSLFKGRANENEVRQVLNKLAIICNPPFPLKDIEDKIQSALRRSETRDRNLSQEVRQYISLTSGYFSLTDLHNSLQLLTPEQKNNLYQIVHRLQKEGFIEKYGQKNGVFRRVDNEVQVMDFLNARTDEFEIRWPLEIESQCKVYPGNIIVVAGSKSAGKTAFLLNVIKENMAQHDIVYLNSEMGDPELKVRLELFENVPLNSWKFAPIIRHTSWADVITDHKKLWIVDYLEMPSDRLHLVADEIRAIHSKLKDGICIIGLQKIGGRDTGRGDTFTLDKSRLYLSLDHGRIKIVDAKAWRDSGNNPRGKIRHFKIVNGSRFIPEGFWQDE